MGPKKIIGEDTVAPVNETIKAKRGRKSKKELMESLNMEPIIKDKEIVKQEQQNVKQEQQTADKEKTTINLNVSEITKEEDGENTLYDNILNDDNQLVTTIGEEPKVAKKRGRKPKGGKIIQQLVSDVPQKEEKPNIILHLKCSTKDLQTTGQTNSFMESYNFGGDLNYEILGNENINNENIFNDKTTTEISTLVDNGYECDEYDDELVGKDNTKEIWRKLKQLEHNLHINNVNNKRSACFWDTCEFDNPPVYIPKCFINGSYHVYGCFCSPECGVAYLMNESIDSSTKFERYHLFNHIYTKIYDYKQNIKPAPNPYYMLEKYYGNLSIQEYRSLLRNERLFLIVDKPLTRILPELHEDNDDFILNNKIIPSNKYQVKTKLQRKKPNKNSILNEKFGNNANLSTY